MLCCTAPTWRMSDHMFATYTRRGRYTSCRGDEMTIWFTTKDVNCDDGRAALPLEFIHWTHHLCHLTVKGGQVTRTSLIHDDNEWTSVDDWRCYWRVGLRSVHQVSLSGGQSLIMWGALMCSQCWYNYCASCSTVIWLEWSGVVTVTISLSPPQARQELNHSHVSAYLRIKKRTTRSRQYLYFRRFLQGICRADNQNHIITYIKEAKDSPKEFGALGEGDVLGEE